MVEDLKRVAEGVGRTVSMPRPAVQIEQEAPDRSRRAVAVVDQLRPVGVPMLHRILLERRDQIDAVPRCHVRRREHATHRMRLGEARLFRSLSQERPLETVEPCDFVFRCENRIVGDIVDGPRVRVEHGDVRAQRRRQQKRADGEVFVSRILAGRHLDDAGSRNGHRGHAPSESPAPLRSLAARDVASRPAGPSASRRCCGSPS